MAQNVIRAYCNSLESYFGETNVRSLIIEKPNVWSPIIANFSVGECLGVAAGMNNKYYQKIAKWITTTRAVITNDT